MHFCYEIMKYSPCMSISMYDVQRQWTWLKLLDFMRNKLYMSLQMIKECNFEIYNNRILSDINNENMLLDIEYISKPKLGVFKIISYILVYY